MRVTAVNLRPDLASPMTLEMNQTMAKGISAGAPSGALARARSIGAELGEAADALNAKFARVEKSLVALALGTTASVVLAREVDEDGDDFVRALRFGKEDRHWGLYVDSGWDNGTPDSWSTTPISNASRETRLLAVDSLPRLVEALIAKAESELAEVKKKNAALEEIIESIEANEVATDDIPF